MILVEEHERFIHSIFAYLAYWHDH
jgi:hypothetical protein